MNKNSWTLCFGITSLLIAVTIPATAWEPTKTVEMVTPASTGSASDQFARVIQGVIGKYNLMSRRLVVTVKAGANGAEGYTAVRLARHDPHKLIMVTSAIFALQTNTGLPLEWTDLTPVAMMAEDRLGLWVNAQKPYKTVKDYLDAVLAAPPESFEMGGTGSKHADQLHIRKVEALTGIKFAYIPNKGSGEAMTQLIGNYIDSNVNSVWENAAQWRAGQVRALCMFSEARLPYDQPLVGMPGNLAWSEIPTCREGGLDYVYTLPLGIMAPGGVTAEQADYYTEVFRKVAEAPEFKSYLEAHALTANFRAGAGFATTLKAANERFQDLLQVAGFDVAN